MSTVPDKRYKEVSRKLEKALKSLRTSVPASRYTKLLEKFHNNKKEKKALQTEVAALKARIYENIQALRKLYLSQKLQVKTSSSRYMNDQRCF